MNIKKQIIEELNKKEFPDLKFFFSKKVLDIALEVLKELLIIDKNKFNKLLLITNTDLTFNSFEDDSLLDYFWSILNHLDNIESSNKIRKIIEKFRPELEDFSHEVSYSRDFFEQLIYVNEKCILDEEEKRIMYLRIKAFKDR
jgi:Zn-dependent oligopeptidase